MTLLYRLIAQEKFSCVLFPLESVVTELGKAHFLTWNLLSDHSSGSQKHGAFNFYFVLL